MLFGTFAGSQEELHHALVLAQSFRQFGGRYADATIEIYAPSETIAEGVELFDSLSLSRVELVPVDIPDHTSRLPYFSKVHAAALCEERSVGKTAVLVWMDEDTFVLQEPTEFSLSSGITLGYRPVMHKNIGSDISEKPDIFWQRIYKIMQIPDSAIFRMVTVAGREQIRPYINAGLLVVRPERGILRTWLRDAETLSRDSLLLAMVREDGRKAIFLHQTALVGILLRDLKRSETVELSARYNYPLFFDKMFGAAAPFDSIDSVTTVRYDTYFRAPEPGWEKTIKGSAEIIEWMKLHFGGKEGSK